VLIDDCGFGASSAQAHDLAAEQPERLVDLQRLLLVEATTYNVLPLDDRRFERFNPGQALPRWGPGRRGAGRGHVPMVLSADETTDVGSDSATPVSDDYGPADSHFTGRIEWVQIDLAGGAEDADHLISDEERLLIAMARQ
jgi:hypothetical protein